jgi:hypothetical protein
MNQGRLRSLRASPAQPKPMTISDPVAGSGTGKALTGGAAEVITGAGTCAGLVSLVEVVVSRPWAMEPRAANEKQQIKHPAFKEMFMVRRILTNITVA